MVISQGEIWWADLPFDAPGNVMLSVKDDGIGRKGLCGEPDLTDYYH